MIFSKKMYGMGSCLGGVFFFSGEKLMLYIHVWKACVYEWSLFRGNLPLISDSVTGVESSDMSL